MSAGLTKVKGIFFLALFFVVTQTVAQEANAIKVRGGFFEDSIMVGKPARFYLSATYPSKINILFPDSTFEYTPLEYNKKEYFTTETVNGISYDSVIYHLSAFEIDSLQALSLPIFQINERDCTLHASNSDTLKLVYVTGVVDTISVHKLPLKHQANFHAIDTPVNYPVIIFVTGTLLIVVAALWFLFGKRIKRHYKIKRMVKAHQAFILGFDQKIDTVTKQYSPLSTEDTLVHWKRYLEQLERVPYTKLTSREIQRLEKDEHLGKTLHSIDAAIYGHNTQAAVLFENLRTFAQQRFSKKLEEVKHG
jgi:hypothetical protein